jgi:bacillithiol biosynthesis deacetylase BshB1
VAERLDVLAFGAHPDDVELGCGGTMLRLGDAGLRLGVVDLTAGERGSRGTAETRAAEAAKAAAMMRLAARETLGFPDTELQPTLDVRRAVVEAIRRHRPRVVLAPLPQDLHPDHAAAGRAVADAIYPSGMRNYRAAGEPFRPQRVFRYLMHDEETHAAVVDVTAVWERRIALARCFESQLHRPEADAVGEFATLISRADFLPRIEGRARVWGRRGGFELGEALVPVGSFGVADVAALFAGT